MGLAGLDREPDRSVHLHRERILDPQYEAEIQRNPLVWRAEGTEVDKSHTSKSADSFKTKKHLFLNKDKFLDLLCYKFNDIYSSSMILLDIKSAHFPYAKRARRFKC